MINTITILPGLDKAGGKENYRHLTLTAGETVSIVGPTGSGKTALISDIELLAQGDSSTRRRILINGKIPSDEIRYNPAMKPIAMITQNTKCFTDLSTMEFLKIHARARKIIDEKVIIETIDLANKFTGEKIDRETRVTVLSGGQTRSLLIADAILIGAAPIILLDEIENAGIFKQEVIDIIKNTSKIIIFVTHDPVIALLSKKRIIMENGAVKKVLSQNEFETKAAANLLELDKQVGFIREKLRAGDEITKDLIKVNFA
ncbi:ATP-binding cassette domain-containing protein [Pelotomaculum terephthalicicum JT]|uniref:ATP-binding cassette domain-containing protein n=1 Tax=Pelotomaculum TaxID=191373 RepID=UPI0009CFF02E|nr:MULTISPECIES: ATP-binding cassette domain-containing protein [Pelotomaculum]MCG9968806.1 ATP-binding cassette domain-containing protein [Pelotomaculum terephthalicicum JT]OPX89754.1 MAG: putative 2-aminoethylphosphonate import ATP-binding protein PhnT [Pelotomaculum sp. PtaB.Bin117]OPY63458.1 MAG: putative 2-aminoethylphosphonate import ATP-binding protein PhnT [Pelotomaculum sp. PtaU1.Bin065]